ncbi:transcriptional corepressor LEUNIG_HOMOLOG-like isoform X2 [Ananas comosus]|uniref:Transcriptional corepressor LEUNIG_HOMOLOG-like isoform X2 n=1 Tax=Ananas comosus TaxID=4615 RepID=A0A6P5FEK1_ANACO|nr:transcriptional corepressor LEUNIG_HOMOLOG-like isoform X2 [Ananas comosus]
MAQGTWEADKMLDVYIYDYLLKRNLQATAKSFMAEGKVATDPVAIDAPGGFLFEWWSVFWDIFIARTNGKHSEVASAYLEVQQLKTREQQQLQMQQLQLMNQRHPQIHRRDVNHPAINGVINSINSDAILASPTASVLAAKIYEERMKHPNSMDSEASSQILDASRLNLLKSAASPGQLVQGNSLNVSPLQLIQEIKNELGVPQRSLPMDASSLYGQSIMQGKSGLAGAGLNQGVSGPLKGWPLTTGIDPLRQNLGIQKPLISSQTQFQVFPQHQQQQQQLLAQAQAHNNLGIPPNYGDIDTGRFRGLPRSSLSGKDGQPNGNDGSIGSPIQANSPKIRPDQAEYVMKNTRKRKPTSSGAANSTGTGNTLGPSSPSTPSTHTPGDGVPMAGNLQNLSIMPKTSMFTDGAGIASSSNQMADLEPFGDVGSFDENVESFLSNDDGDGRDIFAALKRSPAEHNSESLKGFTLNEVDCLRASNSKVVCCHFSSDGKLLASAGHEKKVFLWNMDTRQVETKSEEHSNFITDIRFKPNSTQLATSSSDGTVRLWNAADQSGSLQTFSGHSSQVTSVDFHPKMTQILCSCDDNGEIRLWTIGQNAPTRIYRGGRGKVRFQPRIGQLLAAAAENVVNLFNVEADIKTQSLKGHNNEVLSVCWDESGDFLASVSQDTVKIWSVTQGQCIDELSSNGNQFHSCVFHPKYPKFLVIGGYQSLELWNIGENHRMSIQAHEGLIAALAQSPFTGFVASASHDRLVKIWK